MKNNYPKPIIIIHWLTFVLVVTVYLTGGNPTSTGLLGQIHVIGGISIFILFLIRLGFIFIYKKSIPQNKTMNQYQEKLFKIVRFMFYSVYFLL